jgi:hypothetical protein
VKQLLTTCERPHQRTILLLLLLLLLSAVHSSEIGPCLTE